MKKFLFLVSLFLNLSFGYQVLDDGSILFLDSQKIKRLTVLNLSTESKVLEIYTYLAEVPSGQLANQVRLLQELPNQLFLPANSQVYLELKFQPQYKLLPGRYKYIVVFRQVVNRRDLEDRLEEIEDTYYLPVIAEIR